MTIKVTAENLAERLGKETFEETILFKALSRVPALSSAGPWIAGGGAVRRTVCGEKLESDFDFFFARKEQADKFASELSNMGARLLRENDKIAPISCHRAFRRTPKAKALSAGDEDTTDHLRLFPKRWGRYQQLRLHSLPVCF
jgi:hypothetical protein